MKKFLVACAASALMLSGAAFAQTVQDDENAETLLGSEEGVGGEGGIIGNLGPGGVALGTAAVGLAVAAGTDSGGSSGTTGTTGTTP